MAAGRVDVDAVKTGFAGAFGGGGEFLDNTRDFGNRQRPRFFIVVIVGIFQPDI